MTTSLSFNLYRIGGRGCIPHPTFKTGVPYNGGPGPSPVLEVPLDSSHGPPFDSSPIGSRPGPGGTACLSAIPSCGESLSHLAPLLLSPNYLPLIKLIINFGSDAVALISDS
eukprot:766663-Hanusia_phi.AAC.6